MNPLPESVSPLESHCHDFFASIHPVLLLARPLSSVGLSVSPSSPLVCLPPSASCSLLLYSLRLPVVAWPDQRPVLFAARLCAASSDAAWSHSHTHSQPGVGLLAATIICFSLARPYQQSGASHAPSAGGLFQMPFPRSILASLLP